MSAILDCLAAVPPLVAVPGITGDNQADPGQTQARPRPDPDQTQTRPRPDPDPSLSLFLPEPVLSPPAWGLFLLQPGVSFSSSLGSLSPPAWGLFLLQPGVSFSSSLRVSFSSSLGSLSPPASGSLSPPAWGLSLLQPGVSFSSSLGSLSPPASGSLSPPAWGLSLLQPQGLSLLQPGVSLSSSLGSLSPPAWGLSLLQPGVSFSFSLSPPAWGLSLFRAGAAGLALTQSSGAAERIPPHVRQAGAWRSWFPGEWGFSLQGPCGGKADKAATSAQQQRVCGAGLVRRVSNGGGRVRRRPLSSPGLTPPSALTSRHSISSHGG
uniref:Uncharacterized protein n=1 Tax=Knipowitschia caucasica TaxID=637954 RepID=A0AAV2MH89_KNICA